MPANLAKTDQDEGFSLLGMLGGAPRTFESLPAGLQDDLNGIVARMNDDGIDIDKGHAYATEIAAASFKAGWVRGAISAGIVGLLVGGGLGTLLGIKIAKKGK